MKLKHNVTSLINVREQNFGRPFSINLTKSYKLGQSTLSGIPTGLPEFRISQAETF